MNAPRLCRASLLVSRGAVDMPILATAWFRGFTSPSGRRIVDTITIHTMPDFDLVLEHTLLKNENDSDSELRVIETALLADLDWQLQAIKEAPAHIGRFCLATGMTAPQAYAEIDRICGLPLVLSRPPRSELPTLPPTVRVS